MRTLLNDISRCLDSRCPVRNNCLRYLQRNTNLGPNTPVSATLRVDGQECKNQIEADVR